MKQFISAQEDHSNFSDLINNNEARSYRALKLIKCSKGFKTRQKYNRILLEKVCKMKVKASYFKCNHL